MPLLPLLSSNSASDTLTEALPTIPVAAPYISVVLIAIASSDWAPSSGWTEVQRQHSQKLEGQLAASPLLTCHVFSQHGYSCNVDASLRLTTSCRVDPTAIVIGCRQCDPLTLLTRGPVSKVIPSLGLRGVSLVVAVGFS